MRHVYLGASWPHRQRLSPRQTRAAGPTPSLRPPLGLCRSQANEGGPGALPGQASLPAGPLWALPSKPPQRPLKPGIAREPPDKPAALPVSWPTRGTPARLHSAPAGGRSRTPRPRRTWQAHLQLLSFPLLPAALASLGPCSRAPAPHGRSGLGFLPSQHFPPSSCKEDAVGLCLPRAHGVPEGCPRPGSTGEPPVRAWSPQWENQLRFGGPAAHGGRAEGGRRLCPAGPGLGEPAPTSQLIQNHQPDSESSGDGPGSAPRGSNQRQENMGHLPGHHPPPEPAFRPDLRLGAARAAQWEEGPRHPRGTGASAGQQGRQEDGGTDPGRPRLHPTHPSCPCELTMVRNPVTPGAVTPRS